MLRISTVLGLVIGLTGWSPAKGQPATEFTLENGLDVILLPLPTAKKNGLLVLYDIGNRNDPAGQSGLCHLAEHLYVTAATGNTAARAVDQYMAEYPDGWNAQTGDEYTVFATVFNPDRLGDELADAADRMRRVKVSAADLERELPRIEMELENMYARMPQLAVANRGRDALSPLGASGRRGGVMEQLQQVDVAAANDWLERFYKPGNATLVLAGAFDPAQTRTQIEQLFAGIPAGKSAPITPVDNREPVTGLEIETAPFLPDQPTRVGYTFRVPPPSSGLYPAFLVHASRLMLAGQKLPGNRLSGRSRNQPQAPPFQWRPLDDPEFFYAAIDVQEGETPEAALGRLDKLVQDQLTTPLKKTDLIQTKNMLGLFLGLKPLPPAMLAFNPYGAALALGRQHQMGIDPDQLASRFERVDNEQMRQAAEQVFGSDNRVAVIGRTDK